MRGISQIMLEKIKEIFKNFKNTKFGSFLNKNKLIISLVALGLALVIVLGVALNPLIDSLLLAESSSNFSSELLSNLSSEISSEASSSEISSIISSEVSSLKPSSSSSSSKVSSVTSGYTIKEDYPNELKHPTSIKINPTKNPEFFVSPYNKTFYSNIEDNVFMDSLIYTGYNIKKHRDSGRMWSYVLSGHKPGLGWLSKISYDYDGGTSGYEVNANGRPDIAKFEKSDLVCASYVSYVYFNYLPNVVGIDTSSLAQPKSPVLADAWDECGKKWIMAGYSEEIKFTCRTGGPEGYIFTPEKEIPIGSLILCEDYVNGGGEGSDWACHVSIYAGYKGDGHWVYHVGNDNGPEFCTIERFRYGPDPVWPYRVISTPKNINFAAILDLTVLDKDGNPVKGVDVTLTNNESKIKGSVGKTDSNGKLSKSSINYGEYTLSVNGQTMPITLTAQNNSVNTITFNLK